MFFLEAMVGYLGRCLPVSRRPVGISRWGFSSAVQCSAVETTIICSGSGTLYPEEVHDAGAYGTFTSAVVQSGVTEIAAKAFQDCVKLTSVSLPSSLKTVGVEAFGNCIFTELTIPSSVTSWDVRATNNCSKLTTFKISGYSGTYSVSSGCLVTSTTIISVGCAKAAGSSFTLPSKSILGHSGCRFCQMTELTVPSSVKQVESSAFFMCERLTKLIFQVPSGETYGHLDYFAEGCLECCPKLTSIVGFAGAKDTKDHYTADAMLYKKSGSTVLLCWANVDKSTMNIPAEVSWIGPTVLQVCSSLTSVTLGSTTYYKKTCDDKVLVQVSNGEAKMCLGGVTTVTIDSSVKKIGSNCFRYCQKLQSVNFHSGVTNIGNSVFRDCRNLQSVDFYGCTMKNLDGSAIMDEMMFQDCWKLTKIYDWPTNSFQIGAAAFKSCGFTSLTIPTSVTTIQQIAFMNCSKLQSVTISGKATVIADGCFSYCPSLKSITFSSGGSLQTVESMAFAYCSALPSIELPSGISTLTASCFAFDTSLMKITFSSTTGRHYRSDGIAAYKVSGTNYYHTFVVCPPGLSEITLQSTTNVIGTHAFYGCDKLVNMIMNDQVTRIEKSAFFLCSSIEFIRLTAKVSYIGRRAFNSCKRLKRILYCSDNNNVDYSEGDPFPTDPSIYMFYTFTGSHFCGHYDLYPILNLQCEIPTQSPVPARTRTPGPPASRSRSPSRSQSLTRSPSKSPTASRSQSQSASRSPTSPPTHPFSVIFDFNWRAKPRRHYQIGRLLYMVVVT